MNWQNILATLFGHTKGGQSMLGSGLAGQAATAIQDAAYNNYVATASSNGETNIMSKPEFIKYMQMRGKMNPASGVQPTQ